MVQKLKSKGETWPGFLFAFVRHLVAPHTALLGEFISGAGDYQVERSRRGRPLPAKDKTTRVRAGLWRVLAECAERKGGVGRDRRISQFQPLFFFLNKKSTG